MSARNSFEWVISVSEYAGTALLWLTVGANQLELPTDAPPPAELSGRRSTERRELLVRKVLYYMKIARDYIGDLRPLNISQAAQVALDRQALSLLCTEVSLAVTASEAAGGAPHLDPPPLGAFLSVLTSLRARPRFLLQSAEVKARYWQVCAIVQQRLGNHAAAAAAVTEWRRYTPNNVDSQLRLRLELIQLAESDEERLEHMAALRELGERPNLGQVFSRERLGRLSILRDAFWAIAARVATESAYAVPIVEEAFAAYGAWAYGFATSTTDDSVCLLGAWRGAGRLSSMHCRRRRVVQADIPPELLARFIGDMENVGPVDGPAMQKMTTYIDNEVAPAIPAHVDGRQTRILAGGGAAFLPLLTAKVGGRPLGARPTVAYAHPNPRIAPGPPTTEPFDLLLLDAEFGLDARDVQEAWEADSERAEASRLVRFDSSAAAAAASAGDVGAALASCSRALLFCHVESPIFYAGQAGLVLGPTERLSPEAIAALPLSGLEELVIIGCGSGRDNLFVGGVTVTHAAAIAGARDVLFTMWPINSDEGARFVTEMLAARRTGVDLASFLARAYERDRARASPYAMLRP